MVRRRAQGDRARMSDALQRTIEDLWDARETLSAGTTGTPRDAVEEALALLDAGRARVAEPVAGGGWLANQWLKKAVLLSFRLRDSVPVPGPGGAPVFDKVPIKFADWGQQQFQA